MNATPEPPARPDGPDQPPGAPQPPAAEAGGGAPPEQPPHRRPWGWIVACGFLVVIAVGFGIWALNLNSDLDQQRDETAAAQQQTDAISKQVDDINSELDQAGENAKGILADVKAKIAALIQQIKPDSGGNGGNSGGSGGSGDGTSATATPAAAETTTPSSAQASGTATP